MSAIKGFHHIALNSSDFDRSVAFYKALGLVEAARWGEGAQSAMMLRLPDGGIVEIFANSNASPEQNVRFVHLALAVDDVRAAFDAAIKAGAPVREAPKDVDIPASPALPVTVAFVNGPTGEVIEFFKYR